MFLGLQDPGSISQRDKSGFGPFPFLMLIGNACKITQNFSKKMQEVRRKKYEETKLFFVILRK
jgi:hypothetical protein